MNEYTDKSPSLFILGTRGVPAAHGGFETFAHRFALYMRSQGWNVTVYCQVEEGPKGAQIDYWEGVRRVTFAAGAGAIGTMAFDWACVQHAMRERGVMLVLGYNTAVFSALLRTTGNPVLTNMDGIEWKRAKWPWHGRAWLYINEWIGALTSTALIADHPEIARHLSRRRDRAKIHMIPYGADKIEGVSPDPVEALGLPLGHYIVSIGRIEPENNILPMVQGYVANPHELKFICLGKLEPQANAYHAEVLQAAQGKVLFPGAIYDSEVVKALRFHAAAYCHGHSVGGTNPSLVEALGAANPIIAHDNPYNRWVAGEDQFYFKSAAQFSELVSRIENSRRDRERAGRASAARFEELFRWEQILVPYRDLVAAQATPGYKRLS